MLGRLTNFTVYVAISVVPIAVGGGVEILRDPRVQAFALVCLAWAILESSLEPEQFARRWFQIAWIALAVIGVVAGITISVYEYTRASAALRADWLAWLGLGMAALGLGVRLAAMRTLGRSFNLEVKVVGAQRLVQEGLYKYLRHPSYAGFGLTLLGLPLILNSGLGFATLAILALVGFSIRIAWEERVLIEHFGDEYRAYQKRTKRLIPFVW
jgi:protein-S-isoprenylcysteine O-methyltransferase Ste14